MPRGTSKLIGRIAASLTALCLTCCGSSTPDDPSREVRIGLLLPFTGADSATASNFERAALFAASRVNLGGGIAGKPLRIVSQDTHSDVDAARRSVDALLRSGVRVVIGPESAAIGPEVFQILKDNGVALVSPFVGSGEELTECEIPWFRLAPSAEAVGNALADQIYDQDVENITVIAEEDAYNSAFAAATRARFVARGRRASLELKVASNAQSFGKVVRAALEENADAIVLAASARTGALLINELDATSNEHPSWFLSPSLKTELFVANVSPSALDGAQGVAPAILKDTAAFDAAFAQQWQGDQPLEGAYYYFDAVALVAIALSREAVTEVPRDLAHLVQTIRDSGRSPGTTTDWDEIPTRLRELGDGEPIFYSGLAGPLLFKDQVSSRKLFCGDRLQQDTVPFSVENGRIITDKR